MHDIWTKYFCQNSLTFTYKNCCKTCIGCCCDRYINLLCFNTNAKFDGFYFVNYVL